MSDPIQDYIEEIEGKGGMSSGKKGSATQGPSSDYLQYATTQESLSQSTFVERDMLKSIDEQLLKAKKAIETSKGRVAPPQPRSAAGVKKAVDYEQSLIDTYNFLEGEKAAVQKSLDAKLKALGTPVEVTAQEALVKARTPEGPMKVSFQGQKKPPYLTTDVPKIEESIRLASGKYGVVKIDPNLPGSAATIGPEPAQSPQSAAKTVKPTAVSDITVSMETKKTPGGLEYKSPTKYNVPEMRIGTELGTNFKTGEPISKELKGKIPASQYILERGLKSDAQIVEAYKKQGAEYAAQIAEEQISMSKKEFDFETGEVKSTSIETVMGVKGPRPEEKPDLTDAQKKALQKNLPYVEPTTGVTNYTPGVPSPDAKIIQETGTPFKVQPPTTKVPGGGSAGFGDVGKPKDLPKLSVFTAGPLLKGLSRTFKGKQFGGMVLPKKTVEEMLGMLPGYGKKPEA